MRAQHIEAIGQELAIKWDNGKESFLPLRKLREHCPCAGCKGEVDVMGNLHKAPAKELSPGSYELRSLQFVGGYAIQPVWADGHNTGLFSFDYLKRVAAEG